MKLSELPFGAPFVYKGRVFYKMYPSFDWRSNAGYNCYPVLQGHLQTPLQFFQGDIIVQPYVHTSV